MICITFSNINFKEDLIWIDSQGHEVNILNGSENLITSGAPIVIEFWPYGLKQNNAWDKMKQTLKRFNFYCDLSNDSMELLEVNNENIEKLF